jgi:hypothetical protein
MLQGTTSLVNDLSSGQVDHFQTDFHGVIVVIGQCRKYEISTSIPRPSVTHRQGMHRRLFHILTKVPEQSLQFMIAHQSGLNGIRSVQ